MAKNIPTKVQGPAKRVSESAQKPPAETIVAEADPAVSTQMAADHLERVAASVPIGLEEIGPSGPSDPADDVSGSLLGDIPSVGTARGERLAALIGEDPASIDDDGLAYTKGMVSNIEPAGIVFSQGLVFTDSAGEIKSTSGPASDGMFLGFDVGAMRFDAEMDRKIAGQQSEDGKGGGGSKPESEPASTPADAGGTDSGQTEINNEDGSTTTVYEDGTIVTAHPDGTTVINHPDGTDSTTLPDGTNTEVYKDGSSSTVHPDGTITTTEPTDESEEDPPPDGTGTEIPIEGSGFTLPKGLINVHAGDIASLRQHQGGQAGGDVDPSDGDPVLVTTGPIRDVKTELLGGDRTGPDDLAFGTGRAVDASGITEFDSGVIDPVDDGSTPPQTDGPVERTSGGGSLEPPAVSEFDSGGDDSADGHLIEPWTQFADIEGPVSDFDPDEVEFGTFD